MSFQLYIKGLRAKSGYTQQALADELGVTVLTIKRIEAGKTEVPNGKLLESLSLLAQKSKQEVLFDILYNGDSNYDTIEARYCSCMYLDGWNYEFENSDNPHKNTKDKLEELRINAYLSKKRNPEYKYVVSLYNKIKDDFVDVSHRGQLRNIYGGIVLDDSKFRWIKPVGDIILLDANDEHEREAFYKSKELKYRDFKFNIHLVLFNELTFQIEDEWDVVGKW